MIEPERRSRDPKTCSEVRGGSPFPKVWERAMQWARTRDRRGGIELYSSLLSLGQAVSIMYKYTMREERGTERVKEKGFSSHGDVRQSRLR